MVNKEIKNILLNKLSITKQALSSRAKSIKEKYGPMTTEEAVYIISHQNKIDLSRYLPISQVDRIRSLVPKEVTPSFTREIGKQVTKTKKQTKKNSEYPLVKQSEIDNGFRIGEKTYPLVFILENSIRKLICQELKKKYGYDWWIKAKIKSVRDSVEKIQKKEEKFPYRDKRGKEPIMYTNYDDLKKIIINEKDCFISIIIDMQWFEQKMNETYMARNALAHSTKISIDDHNRIELFFRDWSRMLENSGIK